MTILRYRSKVEKHLFKDRGDRLEYEDYLENPMFLDKASCIDNNFLPLTLQFLIDNPDLYTKFNKKYIREFLKESL